MFFRIGFTTASRQWGIRIGRVRPDSSIIKTFSMTPDKFLTYNGLREESVREARAHGHIDSMRIAVGSDHAGADLLQNKIIPFLDKQIRGS